MPAAETQDVRRGRLLNAMFWGGIGLAPLAVLILLFGQSTGSLRVAVVLAVLTVSLIGVSTAMRPSVDLIRVDIEERILGQVEHIRVRTRADIATAARNTHRALTEQIQQLTGTVEALRAQIVELQARPVLPEPPVAEAPLAAAASPGVVRRTETVHVTRRTTTVDAGDGDDRGTVYGSRAAVDGEWREGRHDADVRTRPDDEPTSRRRDRGSWEDQWSGMAAGPWVAPGPDDRELRIGERRSSVRRDDHGTELWVEDRWAALRRDGSYPDDRHADPSSGGPRGDEPDWEATFRSLSRGSRPALPLSPGESPSRYLGEDGRGRDHDDRAEHDDFADRERQPVRSRGRDRRGEWHGPERYDDGRRDGRDRYERDRDDRYEAERYGRDRYEHDRHDRHDRDRYERDRYERDGHERDRHERHEHGHHDRRRDRHGHDGDYGYEPRPHSPVDPPRPRSPRGVDYDR